MIRVKNTLRVGINGRVHRLTQTIQNINSDFIKRLLENVKKGDKSQFNELSVVLSKIFYFS